MSMRTATIETCSYRSCDKTYKRYAYQVNKGVGLYCSQRCSTLEQHATARESTNKIINTTACIQCDTNQKKINSKLCKKCFNINKNCKPYGMSYEEYQCLLEKQNNLCGICKIDQCSTGRNFAIDHDHRTGRIRGLLCYKCNTSVGWYENKKNNMHEYLALKE